MASLFPGGYVQNKKNNHERLNSVFNGAADRFARILTRWREQNEGNMKILETRFQTHNNHFHFSFPDKQPNLHKFQVAAPHLHANKFPHIAERDGNNLFLKSSWFRKALLPATPAGRQRQRPFQARPKSEELALLVNRWRGSWWEFWERCHPCLGIRFTALVSSRCRREENFPLTAHVAHIDAD